MGEQLQWALPGWVAGLYQKAVEESQGVCWRYTQACLHSLETSLSQNKGILHYVWQQIPLTAQGHHEAMGIGEGHSNAPAAALRATS